MKDRTMLIDALSYAEAGIPVFPLHTPDDGGLPQPDGSDGIICSCGNPSCSNIGKHPRTPAGHKDATTDPDQIRAWFSKWPDANIGIPTGPASGLLVVDADGEAGERWVTSKPDLFPITAIASSGRGLHLYYFYPDDVRVPNSAGKVAPGVDVRGDGGYVVAPPSLHRNGNRYSWKTLGQKGIIDQPPEELPQDAVDLLKHSRASVELAGVPDKIPAGQRNSTFTSMGGKMRRDGWGPREIFAALMQANKDRTDEPLDRGELEYIAKSVSRYAPAPVPEALSSSGKLELYDRDALDSIPPPEWLIRGILTKNSLSVIFGQANVGKTFAALDMALSVATGRDFQGFPVEQEGYVLYVAAEGAYGIGPRVRAWEKHNGIRASRLYVVPRAVQLLQKEELGQFMELLNQTFGYPKLVVIDTLARCMVGGDENAAQDMGRMIAAADRIREQTEGANVMFVHHSGKDGEYERGSTALRGAVDTMVQMQLLDPEDGSPEKEWPIAFRCRKQKDFELFDEKLFRMNQVLYGLGPDERSVVLEETEIIPDDQKQTAASLVDPDQETLV